MNRRQRKQRQQLRASLELDFRGLRGVAWRLTSKSTNRYNCFAWADRVKRCRFDVVDGWWPNNIARDDSIETLVLMYESRGYVRCSEEDAKTFDTAYETIVLYSRDKTIDGGLPTERIIHEGTHAARLLPNGQWTSKLGPDQDISHPTPECLNGRFYGEALDYMRKKRRASVKTKSKPAR